MSNPNEITESLGPNPEIAKRGEAIPALIVVAGRGNIGKLHVLDRETMIIGRALDCDIWVDDDGASRHHARFIRSGKEIAVEDLQSRNGTYCNGEAVTRRTLRDGDKIQLGSQTVLKFSFHDKLDEQLQRNLYESATRDSLTGVHNRKFLEETLSKEFAFSLRHEVPLSIILVDVDNFKQINDTFGHAAGDYVLREIASSAATSLRSDDTFARFGGDEFVAVLRECPRDRAEIVANRLLAALRKMALNFGGQNFKATVSLGLATLRPGEHTSLTDLVAAADQALYRAKEAGKNRLEQS